ncbi:hypothetical protein CR194_19680 [Salipaludibacillus keqinensis]|uniref:Uncharacterized protein n=1 Tax=Salipaludibacillus keqinensis TaxID=2045207 RepID=A0A323T4U7_9BACI|nr:polysaccharide biosynthesis protein [Salipaludibacillus keqinensis]PYZ91551.1 hypothetical protein CR194_19680 [Salipaludibacillus keqinensis]
MDDGQVKKQSWVKGALYLSLAALVVKGLSALYKIPYQNITGDTGFYVYQQVYPIYGVVFVLGTYGFPLVIAKLVAGHDSKIGLSYRKTLSQRLLFIFICLLVVQGTLGILVIGAAETIATLMGDPQLTAAIRWMGVPFFLIPFLAMSRGIYQGLGMATPTALSQVVEQTIRVVVILGVAWVAMQSQNPYAAGTSAGIGALLGGLAAITLLGFVWKKNHTKHPVSGFCIHWTLPTSWKEDLRALFITGTFVSVSAMALVIFQLVDSFTILRLLEFNDWTVREAAAAKGVYDRGWPLIQFGAVVTTVFSYAAIPHITRAYKEKRMIEVQTEIARSIKMCIVFGGAATAGMIAIMPYLNSMMFMDRQGTLSLQVMALIVLFGAIFMTCAALLYAIDKALVSVLVLAGGLMLKGLLNVLFIPEINIYGAAISSSVPFVVMAVLSLVILVRFSLWKLEPFRFWWRWIASIGGMTLIVFVYQYGIGFIVTGGRGSDTFISLSGACIGAVMFIWFIYKLRLFEQEEWESLPKIGRLFPYEKKESDIQGGNDHE